MMRRVAVNDLLLDPISNSVWSLTGVRLVTAGWPNPLIWITESLLTIATTAPGTFSVYSAERYRHRGPGTAPARMHSAKVSVNRKRPTPCTLRVVRA